MNWLKSKHWQQCIPSQDEYVRLFAVFDRKSQLSTLLMPSIIIGFCISQSWHAISSVIVAVMVCLFSSKRNLSSSTLFVSNKQCVCLIKFHHISNPNNVFILGTCVPSINAALFVILSHSCCLKKANVSF